MNKKLTRTLAGVMSLMFMGQIMIFGDGSAQGLLHADTIASAAEAIEGAKNKDQLSITIMFSLCAVCIMMLIGQGKNRYSHRKPV